MSEQIISIAVFAAVILTIVFEKIHRAAAALAGAALLLLMKILTVEHAVSYIDFNTIGVLLGMMLFVAVVKKSGIFEYIAIRSAKIARGNPWYIMAVFVIITAMLSAFLDNVTTVLLIGPMTIAITRILRLDPIPFLMTQILASNIGGTATLIGDPPNIMIGSAAGLTFMDFLSHNGLVILIILAVTLLCFRFIYRKQFHVTSEAMAAVQKLNEHKAIKDPTLIRKSVFMILVVALGFILHDNLGIESSVVALTSAAIMLIIGRQNVEDIVSDVEWPTILFFIGLFIVVGGMVETGVIGNIAQLLLSATGGHLIAAMLIILWVSAFLSSVLDNIPFVATLIPLILTMSNSGLDVTPLWWAVSLGACLGGNGTLIGASANVVLSGVSAKNGHPINFIRFMKIGFPMMILSVGISTVYLLIKYT